MQSYRSAMDYVVARNRVFNSLRLWLVSCLWPSLVPEHWTFDISSLEISTQWQLSQEPMLVLEPYQTSSPCNSKCLLSRTPKTHDMKTFYLLSCVTPPAPQFLRNTPCSGRGSIECAAMYQVTRPSWTCHQQISIELQWNLWNFVTTGLRTENFLVA